MGSGMGLTIAPATESIMGSLPKEKAGVGSAVNDTTRELGGALGVAVVGSLLSSVYTAHLTDAAAGRVPQPAVSTPPTSSVGAALAVAQKIGPAAEPLVTAARQAFVDGMVIGVAAPTAVVAVIGALVALKWLPARAAEEVEADVRDVRDVRRRRSADRHARAGRRRSVDRVGNDMRPQRGGEVRVGRLAPRCCRDERTVGVGRAVEQRLHRLRELVARESAVRAVAVGPATGPNQSSPSSTT